MLKTLKRSAMLVSVPVALALTSGGSFAAPAAPTLFGAAVYNASGVQLTSQTTVPPGYGGISFPVASGTTLNDITNLAATYQMTTGSCIGGSPRYSVTLSGGKSVFLYFGDAPNYTCGTGLLDTGNLTQASVDTSQLGGTFYDTWANALSLASGQTVTDISLVLDAGWATPEGQVAEITSTTVNTTTTNFGAPTSKDQCKHGGWKTFSNPGTFKNQGDCVSFVATQGKNGPNG